MPQHKQQQSKLANILFTRELDKRLHAKGMDDKVYMVDGMAMLAKLLYVCV